MDEQERQELTTELAELRQYAESLPEGSPERAETEQTIRDGEEVLGSTRAYAAAAPAQTPDDDDDLDPEQGGGDISDEELGEILEELGIDPEQLDLGPNGDGTSPEPDTDDEQEAERKYRESLLNVHGGEPFAPATPEVAAPVVQNYAADDLHVAAPAPETRVLSETERQARAYAEKAREDGNRYDREIICRRADQLVDTHCLLPDERDRVVALAYSLRGDLGTDATGLRAYSDSGEDRRAAVDDLFALFTERADLGLTRNYTDGANRQPDQLEPLRVVVPGHAHVDTESADLAGRIHQHMRATGIKDYGAAMLDYEQKNAGQVKSYAEQRR